MMNKRVALLLVAACLLQFMRSLPASGQGGCTPTDPGVTSWLQTVLDGALSREGRQHLGLSHLAGESVVPLQSATGDDSTCNAVLAAAFTEEQRDNLAADTVCRTLYYVIVDRYLLVITPRPPGPEGPKLLPTTVVSLDSAFNEIGALVW